MPTLTVYPTFTGYYSGWDNLVGATYGWEAVDETVADDDTSYLTLPNLTTTPRGMASFSFGSASNLAVTSITVRCRAKRGTGPTFPDLQIGFCRKGSGTTSLHATVQTLTASYVTFTRDFATNPFTTLAWAVGDLRGIELMASTVFPVIGRARITMLNADVTYTVPTNFGINPEPHVFSTS